MKEKMEENSGIVVDASETHLLPSIVSENHEQLEYSGASSSSNGEEESTYLWEIEDDAHSAARSLSTLSVMTAEPIDAVRSLSSMSVMTAELVDDDFLESLDFEPSESSIIHCSPSTIRSFKRKLSLLSNQSLLGYDTLELPEFGGDTHERVKAGADGKELELPEVEPVNHQNHSQMDPSKHGLCATPSYIHATTTIENLYKFREIPQLIAQTTHSSVYKVFSGTFGRVVAVKFIDKFLIPAMVVDKFLTRELDITRSVHHPHIVHCFDIIQPNSTKYAIISEFCSGGTLLNFVLERTHLDDNESARLFRQLSEAIHYLHQNLGVVHRDIKMENILLDKNNDVKLADFGFARYITQAEASTSFCGTRRYSAPQLVEQKAYNPFAADWYASGVVLFKLVTGEWPYDPNETTYVYHYPETTDKDARDIVDKLLTPEEESRGGYYDIIESEWMQKLTNGQWIFAANELSIQEVESSYVFLKEVESIYAW